MPDETHRLDFGLTPELLDLIGQLPEDLRDKALSIYSDSPTTDGPKPIQRPDFTLPPELSDFYGDPDNPTGDQFNDIYGWNQPENG